MNTSCNIIYDLLPLYADKICSEESQALIEEHMKGCSLCRDKYEAMTMSFKADSLAGLSSGRDETSINNFNAKRAFIKIRRRWIASILIIFLIFPFSYLVINEFRGQGISFTNIRSIYNTSSFLSALERGHYRKAFTYLNVDWQYNRIKNDIELFKKMPDQHGDIDDNYYKDWLEQFKGISYEDFYALWEKNFISNMEIFENMGFLIKGHNFRSSYRNGDIYQIEFNVHFSYQGNPDRAGLMFLDGKKGKLRLGAGYNYSMDKTKTNNPDTDFLHNIFKIFSVTSED